MESVVSSSGRLPMAQAAGCAPAWLVSTAAVVAWCVAAGVAAQEVTVYPDTRESAAVAYNGDRENFLTLGHHEYLLSNRRAVWNVEDQAPKVLDIKTVFEGRTENYSLAYNPESEVYLAAWLDGRGVLAVRLNRRGQLLEEPFYVLLDYPDSCTLERLLVTELEGQDRWLVAVRWGSGFWKCPWVTPVVMRIVHGDGSVESEYFEFDLGDDDEIAWNLDFNPISGRLLMVWETESGIQGRFFRQNGNMSGPPFPVGTGYSPSVAYSPEADRWLVVWSGGGILGRLIVGGAPAPATLTISEDGTNGSIGVDFCAPRDSFLVAWETFAQSAWLPPFRTNQIMARWVWSDGELSPRGEALVSSSLRAKRAIQVPFLACSSVERHCLVVWGERSLWGGGPRPARARFVADIRTLTIATLGDGGGQVNSDPPGIECGSDCRMNYPRGSEILLEATPDADSEFVAWSGAADCLDGAVTMNNDKTCRATFAYMPLLAISKSGDGDGTVTSSPPGIDCGIDCSSRYSAGTPVQLHATAASGSSFQGWTGEADCLDGQVVMTSDRSCGAIFVPDPMLDVVLTGTGGGTVTSAPPGIDCGFNCSESFPPGTTVTLTAVPDAGSQFDDWAGDADCSDGTLTMDSDRSCEAAFGPCSIPSEVTLENMTVYGDEAYEACNFLTVGPSVTVGSGGQLDLRAGNSVGFVEPVEVEAGGEMVVTIGPPAP